MSVDTGYDAQASALLFGRRLAEERVVAGLTQARLSQMTGTSVVQIALIEDGSSNPTLELMVGLASAVGAEVWELLVPAGRTAPAAR